MLLLIFWQFINRNSGQNIEAHFNERCGFFSFEDNNKLIGLIGGFSFVFFPQIKLFSIKKLLLYQNKALGLEIMFKYSMSLCQIARATDEMIKSN